jgi:hypothetical protein
MSEITLFQPLVDYLTYSGIDHLDIVESFHTFSQDISHSFLRETEQDWFQYRGNMRYYSNGSVWHGIADQKGESWLCIRISGELAHDSIRFFAPLVKRGILKVTRIDLQATVPEPPDWEQIRLYNRMHRAGKKVESKLSVDQLTKKKLETVAIGSRTSETYTRVYEKITDGGTILLRYEVEHKGGKATAVFDALAEHTPGEMLRHQLDRTRDKLLIDVFSSCLAGISPHNARPKVKQRNKKKQWLLTAVLPSFTEFINAHDDDGEVSAAFLAAIENTG